MKITSVVDVSQVTLNDTCTFYYGYAAELSNVQVTNGIYDSQNVGPVFFRNYAGLNIVNVQMTVTCHDFNNLPLWIAAVIYDDNSVPVTQVLTQTTVLGVTPDTVESAALGNTQTFSVSLALPTWAFVGPANVYVNIYEANPTADGLPYSPEQSDQLFIYNGQ
jgi:hypothetical protein